MKKRNGFTLIELLVVISIIALLLSILMPSLQKVKEQGRRVVCATHQKQCLLALQMYGNENKDVAIPYVEEEASTGATLTMPWDISLRGYFGASKKDSAKEYVACPADRKPREMPDNPNYEDFLGSEALARSYQLNGALDNGYAAYGNTTLINSTPLWWSDRSGKISKTSMIKTPAKVLWMIECFVGSKDENYLGMRDPRVPMSALREGCIQGSDYWGSTWWAPSVAGYQAVYGQPNTLAERGDQHKSGANWGFIDGHVEWFKHNPSASDLYHAYGGPVYPYTWLDTSKKRTEAKEFGWVQ